MRQFTRGMYVEAVGHRTDFPPWPFPEREEVSLLEAFGPLVPGYKPREDDSRFSEPERVEQPPNCGAVLDTYLASRLKFTDFLALQRQLIRMIENRLGELDKWVSQWTITDLSEHSYHAIRSILCGPLDDWRDYLALSLVSDENARFFDKEALWVAKEITGELVSHFYAGDEADCIVAEYMEVEPQNIFKVLMEQAMEKCAKCENPRKLDPVVAE